DKRINNKINYLFIILLISLPKIYSNYLNLINMVGATINNEESKLLFFILKIKCEGRSVCKPQTRVYLVRIKKLFIN
ncbi:hypothetical protein Mgra_00000023, partial [Meloidogyne graminicola]